MTHYEAKFQCVAERQLVDIAEICLEEATIGGLHATITMGESDEKVHLPAEDLFDFARVQGHVLSQTGRIFLPELTSIQRLSDWWLLRVIELIRD